jgi:HEPN domain-containing protein
MNQEISDYIRNWLYRAREDIAVMKDLHNSNPSGYTNTICFHAQQAVEKYLIPRTHDVDYLLMECQKIDSESFNLDLISLTEVGVSVRYPV